MTAPTGKCKHCGKAIKRDSKGYWGARQRNDPHPWYCEPSPAGKHHEPAQGEDLEAEIATLLEAAANAERDADSEWPGSYYRKAHRARAKRLRAKAATLAANARTARG